MFRRSRRKIVAVLMVALSLFLAVTLATVYASSYLSVKKQNTEMLERYVALYSLDAPPGDFPIDGPPDIGDGFPGDPFECADEAPDFPPAMDDDLPQLANMDIYELSSFYSVALAADGTALAVDTGIHDIYQNDDILQLAHEILAGGTMSGTLDNLIYQVEYRDDYTLVAFMDTTLTDNSMDSLLRDTLIVGIIAILVFFVIAVFLANWIIQPLEENDRRQKQFVSDAEHELKTPISVVSANAELLSRQIGDNQWLSNIQYENERMGNLVKDLLELSHAERGAQTLEDVDFSKLVAQEALPFESVAFEHGLVLSVDIAEGMMVKGDRRQLGQLVSILIDNAISHSSGGTDIRIDLKKEHKRAVLVVKNPGEEIPEETRGAAFRSVLSRGRSARGGRGALRAGASHCQGHRGGASRKDFPGLRRGEGPVYSFLACGSLKFSSI